MSQTPAELHDSMHLGEAIDVTRDIVNALALCPDGYEDEFAAALKALERSGVGTNATVGALLGAHATFRQLAATAAGVESFSRFLDADGALRLHRVRNALVVVIGCTALNVDHNPRKLLANLPVPPSAKQRRGRPARSDEVMPIRLGAAARLVFGNPSSWASAAYAALLDSGMHAMGTTSVLDNEIDDLEEPRFVLARAHHGVLGRELEFNRFSSFVIKDYAIKTVRLDDAGRPRGNSLAYRGNQPGTHAGSATVHGVIERLMREVGLTDSSLTAASYSYAASKRAYDAERYREAARIAGVPENDLTRLCEKLHVLTPPDPISDEEQQNVDEVNLMDLVASLTTAQ